MHHRSVVGGAAVRLPRLLGELRAGADGAIRDARARGPAAAPRGALGATSTGGLRRAAHLLESRSARDLCRRDRDGRRGGAPPPALRRPHAAGARGAIRAPHPSCPNLPCPADPELVTLLAKSGAKTLTTAADGASERLRIALDRKTNAAQLIQTAELARAAGFARLKLYLMVGLPGEEDQDLDELVRLASEISRIIPLRFGCAPFVAKRNTPMDGAPFTPIEELDRRIAALRAKLRGRAEIRPTSPRWAWVEYMLAQGDESAGLAAEDAWRAGGSFASWKRAFRERGVTPHASRRVPDGRLRLPQLAAWPSV